MTSKNQMLNRIASAQKDYISYDGKQATSDSVKSVSWTNFKFFNSSEASTISSALGEVRIGLNSVIRTLSKIESVLKAIQNIAKLISTFESLFQNLFTSFANAIIDQLEVLVNDFKHTGVYYLNLIDYHWVTTDNTEQQFDDDYLAAIAEGPWYGNDNGLSAYTDKTVEVIIDGVRHKLTAAEAETAIANGASKAVNTSGDAIFSFDSVAMCDFISNVLTGGIYYRRETYYEFINKIYDAFMDKNDIPLFSIFDSNLFKRSNNPEEKTSIMLNLKNTPHLFRTGRPNLSDNARMGVVVIAYCVSDFSKLLNTVHIFNNFFGSIGNVINGKDNLFGKIIGSLKYLEKEMIPNSLTSTSSLNTSSLYNAEKFKNWINGLKESNEQIKDLFNIKGDIDSNKIPIAEEPNFYGLTLYTFASPLFLLIENVLDYLKSMVTKAIDFDSGFSIIQTINNIIGGILADIQRYKNMIEYINNLLRVIDDLLSITGLRILRFETSGGNYKAAEIIRNSTGFDNFHSKNKTTVAFFKELDEQIDKMKVQQTELVSSYDSLQSQIIDIDKRILNLNSILAIVKSYPYGLDIIDVNNRINKLTKNNNAVVGESIQLMKDVLRTKLTRYGMSSNNKYDYASRKSTGIDKLQEEKQELLEQLNNKLNGYDMIVSGVFIMHVDGLISQLQNTIDEIDALTTQQNDINQPDVVDFDSKINSLNVNKESLIKEIQTLNEDITITKSNYNNVAVVFDSEEINKTDIVSLTDAKNDVVGLLSAEVSKYNVNGEVYNDYYDRINSFENDIDELYIQINNLTAQLQTLSAEVTSQMTAISDAIVAYTDVDGIPYFSGMLYFNYSNSDELSAAYNLSEHHLFWTPQTRLLFDTYYNSQDLIEDIPNQIIDAQNAIQPIQNDIDFLTLEFNDVKNNSIKTTQTWYSKLLEIITNELELLNAYNIFTTSDNYANEQLLILYNERDELIKKGYDECLNQLSQWYSEPLPLYNDKTNEWSDWTNNEIGYFVSAYPSIPIINTVDTTADYEMGYEKPTSMCISVITPDNEQIELYDIFERDCFYPEKTEYESNTWSSDGLIGETSRFEVSFDKNIAFAGEIKTNDITKYATIIRKTKSIKPLAITFSGTESIKNKLKNIYTFRCLNCGDIRYADYAGNTFPAGTNGQFFYNTETEEVYMYDSEWILYHCETDIGNRNDSLTNTCNSNSFISAAIYDDTIINPKSIIDNGNVILTEDLTPISGFSMTFQTFSSDYVFRLQLRNRVYSTFDNGTFDFHNINGKWQIDSVDGNDFFRELPIYETENNVDFIQMKFNNGKLTSKNNKTVKTLELILSKLNDEKKILEIKQTINVDQQAIVTEQIADSETIRVKNIELNEQTTVESNTRWDPAKRYFYGGALFCYGIPGAVDAYTNDFDRIWRDTSQGYKDGSKELSNEAKNQFKANNLMGKLFGK